MASEKKNTLVKVVEAKLATITEMENMDKSTVAVPDGFEGGREVSSFSAIVNFEAPGDYIAGFYKGAKVDVGPNKSMLYILELPGNREIVSVWGSTVLDSKMLNAGPRVGDKVLIQRLEDLTDSNKKGNPPKNFRVMIG